jgi:hypothetical protein
MNLGDLQSVVAMLSPVIKAEIDRQLGGILARVDRIEARLGGRAGAKRDGDAGL